MTTSNLSTITLVAAVGLIIVSQLARRNANPTSKIHLARKVLSVLVLSLAAIYFYMRFASQ